MTLDRVTEWLIETLQRANIQIADRDALQEFLTEDSNRETVRGILSSRREESDLPSTILNRTATPKEYRELFTLFRDNENPPYVVRETTQTSRSSGGYLIFASADVMQTMSTSRATPEVAVGHTFDLRGRKEPERLLAGATLVRNGKLATGEIAVDRTLRKAIAVRPGERITICNVHPSKWTRLRGLAKRFLGIEYIYCRVHKAYYPDMEKPLCRLSDPALDVIGVDHGGRVNVESLIDSESGGLAWKRISLKVLAADGDILREREGDLEKKMTAYYPDFAFLMGMRRDVYWMFLDKAARDALKVKEGEAVRVHRDVVHALRGETVAFLVILMGVLISLTGGELGSSTVSLVAAISAMGLLAVFVVVWKIRSRVL